MLVLEKINAQEQPAAQEELVTLVPLPEHSKALFITLAYLEKYHYRKLKLNDSLSAVVFDNYIEGLDPSKVFLPTPSNTAGTPSLLVISITFLAKSSFV